MAKTLTKSTGEKVPFSKGKFCRSLREAGAGKALVDEVCDVVVEKIKPGDSTQKVFRTASHLLMRKNKKAGIRYSLKRGIAELGPAGFHFEQLVEALMEALGYETERDIMLKGYCVPHETDVYGRKGSERVVVEAKYHNSRGIKTHIDTVMYADARLVDICRGENRELPKGVTCRMWLVTNTKFTAKARKYAACRDIRLTGWKHPQGAGLEDLITRYALYPITILPSMDKQTTKVFAEHNMMLARDLAPYTADNLVRDFNIKKKKAEALIKEAHVLVYGA